MRSKHELGIPLILLLIPSLVYSQLSCHRIPISFCCTSRIRDQCPEQCATVQCGSDFIHSLFSTDNGGNGRPQRPISSGAHDGSAQIGRTHFEGTAAETITKPDETPVPPPPPPTWNFGPSPVSSNSGDTNFHPTTTPSSSAFPTLIPFSSESNLWSTVTSTSEALPEAPVQPRRDGHRRRTTPDPRIIRPPESLVVIGDYDEDEPPSENAVVDSPQPFPSAPVPPPTTAPVISNSGDVFARSRKEIGSPSGQEQTGFVNSGTATALRDSAIPIPSSASRARGVSRSSAFAFSRAHNRLVCRLTTPGKLVCNRPTPRRRFVTPPRFWRRSEKGLRRKNFATNRIHITPFMGELARRRRKLDSGSSQEWKVSIIPRGKAKTPDVNSIPPLTIDGKADERFNKFYRTIDKVINKLELTPRGDVHVREGEPQIRLEGSTKDLNIESSAVVIESRTTVGPGVTNKVSVVPFRPLRFTAPPPAGPPSVSPAPSPQGPPQGVCGVSPDFTPCVSNEVASKGLLECCQKKNLPAGCLQLCRYDITQTEIRAAMDRGQCGIFNVAPFLECASQGKDNSECCRHRGIVQKTGPQCEQFCRPTQGLSALGVQHIVCGNAVGDMLHCHHSGVRI